MAKELGDLIVRLSLAKGDVGLGSVDNTADSAKNVASAAKLTTARTLTASGAATATVGGVTGTAVSFDGTGNVTLPATVPAATTTTAGAMSAADKTKLDAISFVYVCAGASDNVAIQNIIKTFFNSGTATTMNLIITGTMGIEIQSGAFQISTSGMTNTRGAVCNLDFTNCYVPDITTANKGLLGFYSTTARMNVTGLKVTSASWSVYFSGSRHNHFTNCIFTSTSGSTINFASATGGNCHNVFDNCTFISEGASGNTLAIYTADDTNLNSGNVFNNCKIISKATGATGTNCAVQLTNCGLGSSTSFNNCLISHSNIGINVGSSFVGSAVFTGCRIWGQSVGISVASTNATSEIKLMGCDVMGGTYDIQQTVAAGIKWYIMGNSFSKANVIVDGTTAVSYKAASASIYFPQYANFFSRTMVIDGL